MDLANIQVERPDVGTTNYNKLNTDSLLLDMEDRFANGGIRNVHEFLRLLDQHKNDKARIKVLKEQPLFERAMNFRLLEAEANLKERDLKDVLTDYVRENGEVRAIHIVRKRIDKSGHG